MKVLVTGANGMLGQDLCPIFEDNGYDVIGTDVDTLDITNYEMTEAVITKETPDIVIHCAAYTNVDRAEDDIETARLINKTGTQNIAKVCSNIGAILVYISTDYVFDGNKGEPYLPEDKENPINAYGLTKYEGEQEVKKLCEKYYIARTSWLYGHHGRNFVETMISLKDKPEIKVVNDQTGCPTWTVDLANGIAKLIEENPFGTYHVCGGGITTWYDFTKEIYKQMNISTKVIPCTTAEFPRPAKRPKYSAMNNDGICRNWTLALKDYIALRPDEE